MEAQAINTDAATDDEKAPLLPQRSLTQTSSRTSLIMKSLAGLILAGGLATAAVSLAGPVERRSDGFVTQNGTRLYQYGKPLYISGMNYWS